jgi:hypothetical protein
MVLKKAGLCQECNTALLPGAVRIHVLPVVTAMCLQPFSVTHPWCAGGTALSSAALASLGGNTNPAAVVGQYQRYNLDATALAEAAAGGSSEVQQQDASGRGPGGANKKQGGQPQGGPKKGGQGAGQQQQQKVSGPAAGKAGSGQQGKGGVQQGSGKQAGAAAVAAPVSSNARGKRGKVAKMKEKYGDQVGESVRQGVKV